MGSGSSLIEARNWHTVLGISRDWSQRFRQRGAEVSAVTAPVPVVRVVAFEVEGAADFGGQDFVVGQIRCIAP
jgi:hypothetical protein